MQGKHKHIENKRCATKNQWLNKEIKEEIRKYLEMNENESTASQS